MAERHLSRALCLLIAVSAPFWLDLVATETLLHGLALAGAWALGSTLLVAAAGAWVALGRQIAPRPGEARRRPA